MKNNYKVKPQASKQFRHNSTLKSILLCGIIGLSVIGTNDVFASNGNFPKTSFTVPTDNLPKNKADIVNQTVEKFNNLYCKVNNTSPNKMSLVFGLNAANEILKDYGFSLLHTWNEEKSHFGYNILLKLSCIVEDYSYFIKKVKPGEDMITAYQRIEGKTKETTKTKQIPIEVVSTLIKLIKQIIIQSPIGDQSRPASLLNKEIGIYKIFILNRYTKMHREYFKDEMYAFEHPEETDPYTRGSLDSIYTDGLYILFADSTMNKDQVDKDMKKFNYKNNIILEI